MQVEKELEKRFLSEETKSNLKNLKQDYEKSRLIIKEEVKKMKQEIINIAKTKPEILKCDPVLLNKLSDQEYLEKYITKHDPKIIDDKYFDIPEFNQIFLNYDENSEFSMAEAYFMKCWNEDKLRYSIHMNLIDDFEKTFEDEIDDVIEYNEVHIAENSKKAIKEYIKTVRTDHFREYSTSYAKTDDNYRVDVGLIISRRPIFFGVRTEDMEFGKYRRKLMKKYYMDHSKNIEDYEVFNDVQGSFWDSCSGQFKISSDNKPNIRKWNNLDKKYDFYCQNSKHFTLVDPNITNPKSIQYESLNNIYMLFRNKYTGIYEFPTSTLYHGDNFQSVRYKLFVELTKERFKIFFEDEHPEFCLTRKFHDYELEDPKNKGLNGVKSFYFPSYHFRGTPQVFINRRHPYDDFLFATKFNLNKITSEEYYHGVVHALSEV